ncbi:acyltransferase family protein [Pseudomonas sp. NPDC078700]|uniref:acyltransferase family protein n=1 Tax=Pseudomonas sp. NPDC078700 TaxID=3364424 RepID=UPI0037C8D7D8
MSTATKTFRSDINGLRAWAVVSVILYHFGITTFSGGFVGVDVFFVISGFLMTKIIVNGLEKSALAGTPSPFSIISFYLSRARRIIPALLVLCAMLLLAGWLYLPAVEYKRLGMHVASALVFVSNIIFWQEAGYFDIDSHDKLLLHTWSLSVEWQFYLILPLALLAVWKIRPGRGAQTVAIAAGLVLSLLLCILATPIRPSAAFYLLPTRAWEMLAGGLVFLLGNSLVLNGPVRRLLEAGGFVLLIGTITLFDTNSEWPGWRAAVPVFATVMILLAARQGSLWSGSRIAQWLGDCSYSLYLWHWPVVVVLVYLQLLDQLDAVLIGLLITLLMGWLSYQWVEKTARSTLTHLPQWSGTLALLGVIALVSVPALIIHQQQGVPGRLPAQIDAIFAEADNTNPRKSECLNNEFSVTVPECTYGGKKLGVIVIGDSHAAALVRAVERALPDPRLHVLDWTKSNCPTIANVKAVDKLDFGCGQFVSDKAKLSDPALDNAPLIIINRTSYYALGPNEPDRSREVPVPYLYFDTPYPARNDAFLQATRKGIIDTACEFAQHHPVYMLRPVPELKFNVPKTMGRALMQGKLVRVSISLEEYQARNKFIWETQDLAAQRCGVTILDPLPYLCQDGRCNGDTNGHPIYFDDDHLSERGGSLLVPLFRQMFKGTASALTITPSRSPTAIRF